MKHYNVILFCIFLGIFLLGGCGKVDLNTAPEPESIKNELIDTDQDTNDQNLENGETDATAENNSASVDDTENPTTDIDENGTENSDLETNDGTLENTVALYDTDEAKASHAISEVNEILHDIQSLNTNMEKIEEGEEL